MSFFSSLTQIFEGNTTQSQVVGSQDQIIFFLLSLVPQQDKIKSLLSQYDEAKVKTGLERDLALISLYFAFEKFLATNKPPIVNQSFLPEDLRIEITKKIPLSTFPISFQVIFASSKNQPILLYELFTDIVIELVIKSIGSSRFKQIAQIASQGTYLSGGLIYEKGIDFKGIQDNLEKLSIEDQTASFKNFNHSFFNGISSCLGPVPALEFYYRALETIKQHYPQEFLVQVTPILPPGLTETN